jgi:hypothetical protein
MPGRNRATTSRYPSRVGLLLGRERDGDPHARIARHGVGRRRHHANDHVFDTVEPDRRSDDRRVRGKAVAPEPVAQHDDGPAAGLVLVGREHAPDRRANPEHREVIGRDARRRHLLGSAVARDEREVAILDRRDTLERFRPLPPREEVRRSGARVGPPRMGVDANQPIRLGEWQRAQYDRMHDTEDRRGGTNADRERERGHRGEPRHPRELAERVSRVLRELVEQFCALHISISPFADAATGGIDSLNVPEPADGLRARELRVDPARDVLARAHLDVERELRVHLFRDTRLPEEGAELTPEGAGSWHGARRARYRLVRRAAGFARPRRQTAPIPRSRRGAVVSRRR